MIIRSWVWADKWRLTLSSQTPLSADLSLEFPLDVNFLPLTFSHLFRFHHICIISWWFKAHMPLRFLFYFKLFYLRQEILCKFSVKSDIFHVHNDFPFNLCTFYLIFLHEVIFFLHKVIPAYCFSSLISNIFPILICIVCRWFNAYIPLNFNFFNHHLPLNTDSIRGGQYTSRCD